MLDFLAEAGEYLPFLLRGALVTIELSLVAMLFGTVTGFFIALGRRARTRLLRWPLNAFVEIMRDTPLIVQLLIIYFTLPRWGLTLGAFPAAILGLSLNLAAYVSEVFRSTINAVDRGQREAAISLGMSGVQLYRRVIMPQAGLAALPILGGYFIALLKDCALVSFISVNELLRNASIVISDTFDGGNIYLLVAIIYFIMSFASSRLILHLENRLAHNRRSGPDRMSGTVPTMEKEAVR
ncbi:amino acid ABC transporter permease [Asaia krungthepensis]|uniref:Polar amino acid ABC transporter permease n=1 Tax=Asaia krungthepensis NRIC 0535 TaxID=1307925 RepID=A0ABQ0Q3R4_9PROT|nr:amino acid ABC transporter permease [Asaia krungthepensis]GBQ89996.1 polar amino acid ABC transporter permease [Asaia krungthepensis NRIC 0535]